MHKHTLIVWLIAPLVLSVIAFHAEHCFAVTYTVDFDATWSQPSHPTAWDSAAHFSSLIGATHDASVSLWESGALATNGIESMAETGSTTALRNEIQALGSAASRISGPAAGSPDSVSFDFEVTEDASLVSLVTMIAPSPDWFVGVSSLDLMDGAVWSREIVVDLPAYDAGTDNGVALRSSNSDTNPPEPISMLGAPFAGLPALGTFTFTLQAAMGDFDANSAFDCDDIDALMTEVAAGTDNINFDITGDGLVNLADRDAWLQMADPEAFAVGDLDLDHAVGSTDLGLLLNNFDTQMPVAYCGGDVNGDAGVNSTDLGLLLNNFEVSSHQGTAAVPEPATGLLFLFGVLIFALRWRRAA